MNPQASEAIVETCTLLHQCVCVCVMECVMVCVNDLDSFQLPFLPSL